MNKTGTLYKLLAVTISLFIIAACGDDPTGSEEPPSEDDPSNEEPVAVATVDEETTPVGDEIIFDASESSDPDGDDLSYSWDLDSPNGSSAELSNSEAESPALTPDVEGDYTATVTVTDENGESDEDDVTVTAESSDVVEVSNDITSDETWTEGTLYRVTKAIDVEQSATLTIEAGVTVEFEANAGLRVNSNNAALIAEGTETDSVTFTGVQKESGYWRGIAFNSSNPMNKLEYSVVEYGGYENWTYIADAGNVTLISGGSNVTITNSTFRHSGDFGLIAGSESSLPDFSDNTFTDNEVAAGITTTAMGYLDGGSSYSGNAGDYVLVMKEDVDADMTVTALNVPYRVQGRPDIEGDAEVTIGAGVTIEFTADAGIRVPDNNAALMVEGTESEPVTLTGVQQSPGYWYGIAFYSSNPMNKLDHAVIEYGGSESWTYIPEAGNVSLREGANLEITNSVFRHSSTFGLFAASNATLPDFSNNSFSENDEAAGIPTTMMGEMDSGSSFTGNNGDYVLVGGQDVDDDMTISPLNVPYRVDNNPDIEGNANVTIEPGVTIEFTANAGIRVPSDDAALMVQGTENDPVTLTGVQQSPGYWRGIAFYSSNPMNELDHAVIEYGGSESWAYIGEAANVSLRSGARLTLTNSVIENSDSYGGWSGDGTSADITVSGNSYSNNADGDNNYGDSGN